MSIRSNRSKPTAWSKPEPHAAPSPPPLRLLTLRPLTLVRSESEASPSTPRDPRQGGQSQDQALYSCGCGHRFEALVSTSVGCPRCGGTQAW